MESTSKNEEESKLDSTLAVAMTPTKHGRLPTFIRDKLAYFKLGSTLSTYRRHLQDAEVKVITLAEQCKALRHDLDLSNSTNQEMSRASEAKMRELSAANKAQITALNHSRRVMQTNMDGILKDHIALNDAKEKVAKQLKEAAAQLKLQGSMKGALNGKLILAEQQRESLQTRLDVLEAKYAGLETKYVKQKEKFDNQSKKQQTMFDNKYMAQNEMFATKYKEQQAMFDTKYKEQMAAFDATYKSQEALFHTKGSDLKATFDNKLNHQGMTFTAQLRNEKLKCEELEKQKEALVKRLGTTETALLKSRQVKVNQEYQFTDAVNSLVPKDEMLATQVECVLYKKIMSVFAALVLVLMTVVFVGLRFLFI